MAKTCIHSNVMSCHKHIYCYIIHLWGWHSDWHHNKENSREAMHECRAIKRVFIPDKKLERTYIFVKMMVSKFIQHLGFISSMWWNTEAWRNISKLHKWVTQSLPLLTDFFVPPDKYLFFLFHLLIFKLHLKIRCKANATILMNYLNQQWYDLEWAWIVSIHQRYALFNCTV